MSNSAPANGQQYDVLLSSVLFGVELLDPLTCAAVAIVLALTAALATAAPVWRASRIDPAVALRNQ